MNNYNSIDYVLRCCEQGLIPTSSDIENAKNEFKKLQDENIQFKKYFERPVAYGMINDRYDIYNLRIQNNPYYDQTLVIPLYSNRDEFLKTDWIGYNYGKHSK